MKSPAPIRVLDHLPSFRGFPWNKSLLEPIKLLDVLVSITIVDAGNRSWEHRDTWSCRILTCRLKNVGKQTPSQTQSYTSPIVIPILLCIISTQCHEQSIHPTADLLRTPSSNICSRIGGNKWLDTANALSLLPFNMGHLDLACDLSELKIVYSLSLAPVLASPKIDSYMSFSKSVALGW